MYDYVNIFFAKMTFPAQNAIFFIPSDYHKKHIFAMKIRCAYRQNI